MVAEPEPVALASPLLATVVATEASDELHVIPGVLVASSELPSLKNCNRSHLGARIVGDFVDRNDTDLRDRAGIHGCGGGVVGGTHTGGYVRVAKAETCHQASRGY